MGIALKTINIENIKKKLSTFMKLIHSSALEEAGVALDWLKGNYMVANPLKFITNTSGEERLWSLKIQSNFSEFS